MTHNIDMDFFKFQDLRNVFGICEISVLPSIYGGFALTCLEFLAMGCPVIRSNTPGWSDRFEITRIFEKRK